MKILQVSEFFTPTTGGSTQVAYQISHHLTRCGHQVTLCSSNFGKNDTQFPDITFRIEKFSALPTHWKFFITPELIPWTRKHLSEFDIIHMHNVRTFQNAVIAAAARKLGIPYILSAHGSLPYLGGYQAIKRTCDILFAKKLVYEAKRLIAVSELEVDQYLRAGVPKEKIAIIHNGLDIEEFVTLPERGTFRRKYKLSDDKKIILFLGRLHKIKGVHNLIEAFALVKTQRDDTVLVIAGPDDGELSALQGNVRQLGLDGSVIFTGPLYTRDKLCAYVDADLLAYPSMHEIFGLVPFEALMCGTPVVVTDECGS